MLYILGIIVILIGILSVATLYLHIKTLWMMRRPSTKISALQEHLRVANPSRRRGSIGNS